jgi:hypothetical protein
MWDFKIIFIQGKLQRINTTVIYEVRSEVRSSSSSLLDNPKEHQAVQDFFIS